MKKVKTVVTGVGSRIKELIKTTNLSNQQILEIVRKEHPLRQTTYACVAWYQSDLRKKAKAAAEAQDTSAADAWAEAEGLKAPVTEDTETLDDIISE